MEILEVALESLGLHDNATLNEVIEKVFDFLGLKGNEVGELRA
ncbi:hypothetical protein [Vibrio hepatarius]|nr:hypothetical protein [Vibrio hepatarius]